MAEADYAQVPTPQQVVDATRAAAKTRRLVVHPRCQEGLVSTGFDALEALELLSTIETAELVKSEPDKDLARRDWIAGFRVTVDDEDLYVKVALKRPKLVRGKLLSFKPWID